MIALGKPCDVLVGKGVTEIPAARIERIRALVSANGVVSLRSVQAELGVSPMTVRRDFAALESLGVVRRTRGGVVAVDRVAADRPYEERQWLEAEAKDAIGAFAASLVEGGDTIFLSGGTTCLALARALSRRAGVTVITNSVPALELLMANPALTVIATGGLVDPRDSDMTGPAAEAALMRFRAGKAFVGASGLTSEGIFNASLGRASTDRLMIEGSTEAYVLADHTKIGGASLTLVVELDAIGAVVTDSEPSTADAGWLRSAGVKLLVAQDHSTGGLRASARRRRSG